MRSKVLGFVLSGVLAFSMVPSPAFAASQNGATGLLEPAAVQQIDSTAGAAVDQANASNAANFSDQQEKSTDEATANTPANNSGAEASAEAAELATTGSNDSANSAVPNPNGTDSNTAVQPEAAAASSERLGPSVTQDTAENSGLSLESSLVSELREQKLMLTEAQSDSSFTLPASSAELEAGTYTVSANVSMLTPLGFPGYTTSPYNPEGIGGKSGIPSAPVTDNATLVVGADGSRTLTVDLVNPVFTVQSVESSDSVTVKNVVTQPIETKTDDEQYNKDLASAGITSRISQVTVNLNNWTGSYQFANWKVYATTLGTFFPNADSPSITSLDLSVDLANVKKRVSGDFQKTYTDAATGISVTVSADKEASTIARLQNAQLKVEKVESGADHDAAVFGLAQHYASTPTFDQYKINLVANGESIQFDDKTSASVTVPASANDRTVYQLANGELIAASPTFDSGAITFSAISLGNFVFVDHEGASAYSYARTVVDSSTGASMTYSTDGSFEEQIFSRDYPGVSGGELLDAFMPDVEGVFSTEAPDTFLQKVAETASSDGTFASSHVQGAFAMAIVGGRQTYGWKIGAPLYGFGSIDYTFTAGKNPLSVSLPVSSDDVAVYAVTGTHGGAVQTVKRLSAHVVDGYAQVSLNDSDVQISNFATLMYHSAVGALGLDNLTMEVKPLTDNSEVAYLVVVEPAETPVDKPTAATGLVYNGTEQIGVAEGEGYDLVSNSATNAGTYTTIATLKDGYVWSDGTADPVVLTWSIGKAILTASYQSRTITVGQTPVLAVDVNGFVNGEDASTAAGYEAPTASAADSLDEGTYEITPRGGNADNYQFAYVGGTLTVKAAKKLEAGSTR